MHIQDSKRPNAVMKPPGGLPRLNVTIVMNTSGGGNFDGPTCQLNPNGASHKGISVDTPLTVHSNHINSPPLIGDAENSLSPQAMTVEGSQRSIHCPEIMKRFMTVDMKEEPMPLHAKIGIEGGYIRRREDMFARRMREEGWNYRSMEHSCSIDCEIEISSVESVESGSQQQSGNEGRPW